MKRRYPYGRGKKKEKTRKGKKSKTVANRADNKG